MTSVLTSRYSLLENTTCFNNTITQEHRHKETHLQNHIVIENLSISLINNFINDTFLKNNLTDIFNFFISSPLYSTSRQITFFTNSSLSSNSNALFSSMGCDWTTENNNNQFYCRLKS